MGNPQLTQGVGHTAECECGCGQQKVVQVTGFGYQESYCGRAILWQGAQSQEVVTVAHCRDEEAGTGRRHACGHTAAEQQGGHPRARAVILEPSPSVVSPGKGKEGGGNARG